MLERQLGTPLFERVRGGVILTEAGRTLLPYATALEHRLAAAGIEAAEIVRIDSLTAQKRLVEAGFGIALLIESSVQEELRLGSLEIIDAPALRGGVPVTLVRRRNGYLSRAARSLVAVIKAGAATRARRRRAAGR